MQPTEKKTAEAAQPVEQQGCAGAASPQKEHEWLHQMVGEWTCEGEAVMQPGQPPATWKATETVRSVGGLWVIGGGTGEMPGGGTSETIITLGFDPQKGKFVGTFVASMMTHQWVYEGELDETGKVLTLNTEGPAMTPGAPMARYRDVVELKSADERTLTSYILPEGGDWTQIMIARYKRK